MQKPPFECKFRQWTGRFSWISWVLIASTQNNPYEKMTYFGVVKSIPLQVHEDDCLSVDLWMSRISRSRDRRKIIQVLKRPSVMLNAVRGLKHVGHFIGILHLHNSRISSRHVAKCWTILMMCCEDLFHSHIYGPAYGLWSGEVGKHKQRTLWSSANTTPDWGLFVCETGRVSGAN